jgi:hypothetical protein
MHDTITFAHDKICDGTHEKSSENGCFYSVYDNSYIHTNGDDYTKLFTFIDGKEFACTITRCDYHVQLYTILQKNKYSITHTNLSSAICSDRKFIYTITPRYFIKLLSDDSNYNFLKCILTPEHVKCINNGQCLFFICDITESSFYTISHLRRLRFFCKEICLDTNKINILTINPYNAKPNIYDITITHFQYFECAVRIAREFFLKHNYIHFTPEKRRYKKYKVLLLNSRPRQHRYYTCYQLWKKNKLTFNDVCISLERISYDQLLKLSPYTVRDNLLDGYQFFNSKETIESEREQIEIFLAQLPLLTEFDTDKIREIKTSHIKQHSESVRNTHSKTSFFKHNHWDTFNIDMYRNCDIHVVTETLAEIKNTSNHQHLFITEKTYKPIAFRAPFIVIGQPGILKYLKSCGYMTFSELWDESYDDEEHPLVRVNSVINVIDSLLKLPEAQYNSTISKAKQIAKYNFEVFKKRIPEQPFIDIVKNFLR